MNSHELETQLRMRLQGSEAHRTERLTLLLAVDDLLAVVEAYNQAADKFIQKCQDGRARSIETLRDLQACREAAKKLEGYKC